MKPNVIILTNIPTPYRVPFFRELLKLCSLHIIFDAAIEHGRVWAVDPMNDVPHTFAKGITLRRKRRRTDGIPDDSRELHMRYGVFVVLMKLRPNVVVASELGPRSLLALIYCRLTGAKLILWTEGTPHTEGWVRTFKSRIRRLLVRNATRFWVNGIESAILIRDYGALSEKIDEGMTGVDTLWFMERTRENLTQRNELRSRFGVRGATFLFVGQLIPRKGVQEFLKALEKLDGTSREFSVLLAGEGPQRTLVEEWAAANPWCNLQLLGHLKPDDLAQAYSVADVFVLPTLDDNWSLATLEAAVAGLPQVFSKLNGAVADLKLRGVVGEVIDPRDPEQFGLLLARFADKSPARLSGEVIQSLMLEYSPISFAERAYHSVMAALDQHEPGNAREQDHP